MASVECLLQGIENTCFRSGQSRFEARQNLQLISETSRLGGGIKNLLGRRIKGAFVDHVLPCPKAVLKPRCVADVDDDAVPKGRKAIVAELGLEDAIGPFHRVAREAFDGIGTAHRGGDEVALAPAVDVLQTIGVGNFLDWFCGLITVRSEKQPPDPRCRYKKKDGVYLFLEGRLWLL